MYKQTNIHKQPCNHLAAAELRSSIDRSLTVYKYIHQYIFIYVYIHTYIYVNKHINKQTYTNNHATT
jgi:transglutaminase-like putative cysteine protease